MWGHDLVVAVPFLFDPRRITGRIRGGIGPDFGRELDWNGFLEVGITRQVGLFWGGFGRWLVGGLAFFVANSAVGLVGIGGGGWCLFGREAGRNAGVSGLESVWVIPC